MTQSNFKTPGKRSIDDTAHGAELFLNYLYSKGIFKPALDTQDKNESVLIKTLRSWLVQHRGLPPSTVYKYCRDAN